MSTHFQTNFDDSGDDIIHASQVIQFAQPTNDLESGKAFYRVASGDGTPYEVSFRMADSTGGTGHHIDHPSAPTPPSLSLLQAGQMVVFKANVDSPADASLAILLEDGASGTLSSAYPLFAGGAQVGADEIQEEQIVVAIFNDTSPPRFDVVGVSSGSGGGGGLTSPVGVADGGTGATTAAGARTNLGAQAQDSALDEIAGLDMAKGDVFVHNGTAVTKLGPGTNGQVLSADSGESTGLKWVAQSTPASSLDGLTDVTITSPASGQSLRYNGTVFVNAALGVPDVADLQDELDDKQDLSAKGSANGYAGLDATGKVPTSQLPAFAADLDDLGDVAISSPASGQVLKYDGTNFVNASLAASEVPSGVDAAKIGGGGVSNTEFGYLDGVTSSIQTQLDGKASSSHTHALGDLSNVSVSGYAGGKIVAASGIGSGFGLFPISDFAHAHAATDIGPGTVSNTEFGYLDGVTSAIQDQLDDKQAQSDGLDDIAALAAGGSAGDILVHDGSTFVALAKSANEGDVLSIDSGSVAWAAPSGGGGGLTSPVGVADGGTGATTAAGARTNLDVPSNAALTSGLAGKSDTGHTHNAATDLTGSVPVANGGTGATTAAGARTNLDVPSNADLTSGLAGKQGLNARLTEISGITLNKGDIFTTDGANIKDLAVGSAGQVLTVDSAAPNGIKWAAPTSGATSLDGLTDAAIVGTPSTGQVLRYNGTNFVNSDLPFFYAGSNIYGTGASGAVTYSSNTTITADVHATSITVNSGVVVTIGWNSSAGRPARLYATSYIRVQGTIRSNGSAGGNATSSTGGAGGGSITGGGGSGGGYTAGDSPGAGGTSNGSSRNGFTGSLGDWTDGGFNVWPAPGGDVVAHSLDFGGRGGSGASNNSTSPGGGGGGGGGTIQLFSPRIWSSGEPTQPGIIEAKGGAGGTGGGGFRGGDGGSGGTIVIVQRKFHPEIWRLTLDTRGGSTLSGGFGSPGGAGAIMVISETPFGLVGNPINSVWGAFVPLLLLPE